MEQIAIDVVLKKLNDTVDVSNSAVKSYGLRYLDAQGSVNEYHCRKFTKHPKTKPTQTDKRGSDFYNLQRNGVILIEDLNAEHPRTLKVATIFGFRDYQSNNWLTVFH
jgi:hypothetical protein